MTKKKLFIIGIPILALIIIYFVYNKKTNEDVAITTKVTEGTFINEFELWVFDRWGNVVFHSKNPNKGWDGSDPKADFAAQNLVYSYRVLAKGFNSQLIDKKGSVTVVR